MHASSESPPGAGFTQAAPSGHLTSSPLLSPFPTPADPAPQHRVEEGVQLQAGPHQLLALALTQALGQAVQESRVQVELRAGGPSRTSRHYGPVNP